MSRSSFFRAKKSHPEGGFQKGNPDLVFIFIEEEVFFRWIVWPNVFNGFKGVAFIFQLLQVFNHFKWCSSPKSEVN